jgi:hypothetical protein
MQTDINAVNSAGYTVLDSDGYAAIHVQTGASNRTVTLPTAADNTDRVITIKKTDSAAGKIIVDGENAETIDGDATVDLLAQYDSITLRCNGTGWNVVNEYIEQVFVETFRSTSLNADATGTLREVMAITLPTAGEWLISATVMLLVNSASLTTGSNWEMNVGATSASNSGVTTVQSELQNSQAGLTGTHRTTASLPAVKVSVSAATTYYVNASCVYTAGSPQWRGYVCARRITRTA